MQLGCCLALVVVPLLLLATPQRATLQVLRHHTGAALGRVGSHASLLTLSTSWTTPVVFADLARTPAHTATPTSGGGALDAAPHTRVESVSFRVVVPPTTTTTAPPPPVPAPAVVTPVPTTPPPVALKPVVPAPKPVAPTPPPAPPNTATGLASWYGSAAGTCASPSLAFGTVVTLTDLSTGHSVRCTVDDREARNPGRVIDLSPGVFSQLASLAVGVIEVRLAW